MMNPSSPHRHLVVVFVVGAFAACSGSTTPTLPAEETCAANEICLGPGASPYTPSPWPTQNKGSDGGLDGSVPFSGIPQDGAAPDGRAPSPDASTSSKDAGRDAGRDSGSSPIDSGLPRDSGTAPKDSGTTPPPPTDASATPVDAGGVVTGATSSRSCNPTKGIEEGPACSVSSSSLISLTVVNSCSKDSFRMYWVDFSCQEKDYGSVGPGQTWRISTYPSHPWRIRHATTGELIYEFTSQKSGTITIP